MEKSRSLNSSRNVATGYINKTVNMLLGFVSKTVFIKVFGVGLLGINNLFSNVLAFLCLADLGLSTAMTYSYYKPIAENDTDRISALNNFYKKIYIAIAASITVIGLALIPVLKYIINLDYEVEHLYLYYILTLANTVVSYLFVYKSTVLYAQQEGYVVLKYNMLMNTLSVVVQIVLMLLLKNYIVYLSVAVFFTFINNLYISSVANKRYPYIKDKKPLEKEARKDIFGNIGSVFLYKVSSVLLNSTDNIIISKMIGTETVGYYGNYLQVVNMITSYVTILFQSLTASIGNLIAKDSEEKQFRVFKNVQVISAWFCIVVSSCVYALINDFIVIWLGEDFLLDGLTVIAVAVNFFLVCLLNPIWIYREAAGIYRKTKYIMVICAVVNLVVSIILGKWIGLSGILFASAIARLSTYVWYEPIVLFKNYFKRSSVSFFLSAFLITGITVATSYALSYLISVISFGGIFGFILKCVLCFIVSNVVFLIFYGRSSAFKDVINYGIKTVKKLISR